MLTSKELNWFRFVVKSIVLPTVGSYFIASRISFIYDDNVFIKNVLSAIGFIVIAGMLYLLIRNIYRSFIRRPRDVRSYGKWAIVTGSTSGIGEVFCHELASRGMNILQIARNEDKLRKVAADIKSAGYVRRGSDDDNKEEEDSSIRVEYLVHDFSAGGDNAATITTFLANLESKLTELSTDDDDGGGGIGMLVNCVGVSNDAPCLTHELDENMVNQMLNINNNGTTYVTRSVLPFMTKRKKGAVITISSGSATHATPLLSIYSATKAYGRQLTRSMYYEYKEYGIDCLLCHPYYFLSNLYRRPKPRLAAPHPRSVVRGCLSHLGYEAETYGYWVYRFSMLFLLAKEDFAVAFLEQLKTTRERVLERRRRRATAAREDSKNK